LIAAIVLCSGLIIFRQLLHQGYNEFRKMATQNICHEVSHGPFPDLPRPGLLVLQGRPQARQFRLYSSAVFKEVRKINTTFFPRPANEAEWTCALIRTYRNVLEDYFASSDAPYVITAEDDVELNGNMEDLEAHILSVLASVQDGFYSFYRPVNDGTCSYGWGTPMVMIRREFMKQLQETCFNQCDVPIDLCISRNWNFRKSQKRLVKLIGDDSSTNPGRRARQQHHKEALHIASGPREHFRDAKV
jgi:hypothetical protein